MRTQSGRVECIDWFANSPMVNRHPVTSLLGIPPWCQGYLFWTNCCKNSHLPNKNTAGGGSNGETTMVIKRSSLDHQHVKRASAKGCMCVHVRACTCMYVHVCACMYRFWAWYASNGAHTFPSQDATHTEHAEQGLQNAIMHTMWYKLLLCWIREVF